MKAAMSLAMRVVEKIFPLAGRIKCQVPVGHQIAAIADSMRRAYPSIVHGPKSGENTR